MRLCTIIARNYWAHARVLAASFREHHPDAEITVLVVDGGAATLRAAQREPFRVIGPDAIGLDRDELERMAAIYDVMELSTALKPWLLRTLLDADDGPVLFLDPDIEVFASLAEVMDLAQRHGIVLTPHNVAPLPHDHREPGELTILGSGIYNLGFIALGQSARPFLDWWGERLRRDGLIAKAEAMFVDQRWVDLVPTYFDPHVIRDPGWNVAYWNLPNRDVDHDGERYVVNGSPLRFFHYSGFDADRPDLLSRFQGDDPRITFDERPVLGALCGDYARKLILAGHRAHSNVPYGFRRSVRGLRLDHGARTAYRHALIEAERTGEPEPPNPFDSDEAAEFPLWLRDEIGYIGDPEIAGVNVTGYVHAESGVGECVRALVAAIDAAGVKRSVTAFDRTASRQEAQFLTDDSAEHRIDLVAVNADQLPSFVRERASGTDNYMVGVWNWEVERMPRDMARAADLVDEVWVASEHTARAVRAATPTPVYVFPIPVVAPTPATRSRAELGLPDGFLFLFCFDFDSVFARKDPLAVVEAFTRAFAPGDGPHLAIKSVRGDAHPDELARLRAAAEARPDVHVIDGYLASDEQQALMATCDAYVSLHRAEGFGLTLAEAMALGKPVIATGYSGNLEFMDETNSFLVPFEMTDIGRGAGPYPPDARWAEPDVDAAASFMQGVVRDAECATERGKRAADDIARLHAPRARASFLIERLTAITRDLPGARVVDEPEPHKGEARRRIAAEEPLAAARAAVASRPDVESPARYERLSRPIRRTIGRLLRHYDDHRMKADSALLGALEAVREEIHLLEANVGDEIQKLFRLERRTDVLERRDGELQDQLADLTERMRTLEGQLRRERRLRRDLIERVQRVERTDVRDDPPGG